MRLDFRKLRIMERELSLKEKEIELQRVRRPNSSWNSPLTITLAAGAVGLIGNVIVSYYNSAKSIESLQHSAENARILEMIKIGDSDQVRENLMFLIESGLIDNEETRKKISSYYESQTESNGPGITVERVWIEPTFEQMESLTTSLRNSFSSDRIAVLNTGDYISVTVPVDLSLNGEGDSLRPEFDSDFIAISNFIRVAQVSRVLIEGHTDSSGPASENLSRAESYAIVIADALSELGLGETEVLYVSYGENRPVATNQSEAGRRSNNRIVLLLFIG